MLPLAIKAIEQLRQQYRAGAVDSHEPRQVEIDLIASAEARYGIVHGVQRGIGVSKIEEARSRETRASAVSLGADRGVHRATEDATPSPRSHVSERRGGSSNRTDVTDPPLRGIPTKDHDMS